MEDEKVVYIHEKPEVYEERAKLWQEWGELNSRIVELRNIIQNPVEVDEESKLSIFNWQAEAMWCSVGLDMLIVKTLEFVKKCTQ